MSNFLSKVNLSTGEVKGCLTPEGDTPTLYHAKPILIQGSFLAAKYDNGNFLYFQQFQQQMVALLKYWDNSTTRVDRTGLHRWHDQLETGADNLVFSVCPSQYSPCWSETLDAFTLSSPDLELFIAREHLAYAAFLQKWAAAEEEENEEKKKRMMQKWTAENEEKKMMMMQKWTAEEEEDDDKKKTMKKMMKKTKKKMMQKNEIAYHKMRAKEISDTVDSLMFTWIDDAQTRGYYGAFNTSTQSQITNRVYQAAWPLWSGGTNNVTLIQLAARELFRSDLWSSFGVRSVSSGDPRYNNDNIINPYSNWRGPIWINVNAVLAHALNAQGFTAQAQDLSARVVHTLADDLRATGTWHESYSSETGEGLAAPGFLSWNTLGATLIQDINDGFDPFAIE